MREQQPGCIGIRCTVPQRKSIPNYGFMAFVNTETVAADAPAIERNIALQNAGLKILQEKLGGAAIVPAQTLAPELSFLLQQRPQLTPGEVAQVENFELRRDRQAGHRHQTRWTGRSLQNT